MGERYYPLRASRAPFFLYAAIVAIPMLGAVVLMGAANYVSAGILLMTALILVGLYASSFQLRYEVDDREIRFRQGLFATWRIKMDQIERVMPARGPAGVSVRKIDCLMVVAGKQTRLIDAPDPEIFLSEVAARAPHLRRYGAELRAAPEVAALAG